MNTHANNTQQNKSHSVVNEPSQKKSINESTSQFIDNRPTAIAQRKLQKIANNRPRTTQLETIQLQSFSNTVQLVKKDDLGLFQFELYTKIKEELAALAPNANQDDIHLNAQSCRNEVMTYLRKDTDFDNDSYQTSMELGLMHFQEQLAASTGQALNQQIEQDEIPSDTSQKPEIAYMDDMELEWSLPSASGFIKWATNNETPKELNCWEFVIYWAVNNNLLSKEDVKDKMTYKEGFCYPESIDIMHSLTSLGGGEKKLQSTSDLTPGNIIKIMDPVSNHENLSHAAISLGGDDILHLLRGYPVKDTLSNFIKKTPHTDKDVFYIPGFTIQTGYRITNN